MSPVYTYEIYDLRLFRTCKWEINQTIRVAIALPISGFFILNFEWFYFGPCGTFAPTATSIVPIRSFGRFDPAA